MAIAQPPTGEPDNGQGSQSALRRNFEPVAARIFQALILVLGMLLLLSVLLGNRWGPMVVGVLIIATTLPPLRHLVDRWLIGCDQGSQARQATIARAVLGALIAILSFTGFFRI